MSKLHAYEQNSGKCGEPGTIFLHENLPRIARQVHYHEIARAGREEAQLPGPSSKSPEPIAIPRTGSERRRAAVRKLAVPPHGAMSKDRAARAIVSRG